MRVVCSLTVAVLLTALAGGCDRRGNGAKGSASAATSSSTAPVSSDFLLNGKDPAQALYNAIRILPDARKVARLLDEHPDWINREISGERPLWLACEARSLPRYANFRRQTVPRLISKLCRASRIPRWPSG